MSRYSEALGKLEFSVAGLDFSIKPKKGDNLKFVKLQAKHEKDNSKLMEEFVPWIAEIIAREEDLAKEDKEDLETFIETHLQEFFTEVLIAFKWTTREKMEQAQSAALDKQGFPNANE